MKLTKPAGVALQLMGAISLLSGLVQESYFLGFLGVALLAFGRLPAVRKG